MADFQAGDCIDIDLGESFEIVIPSMSIRIDGVDYDIENYNVEDGSVKHEQVKRHHGWTDVFGESCSDSVLNKINEFLANYGPGIGVGPGTVSFWEVK